MTVQEKNTENMIVDREKLIVRTGIVGILSNLVLVGFKAFVGLAGHSVAIVSDALNNLTDALSSVITIIGTRLANRAPDKKHPLGHGRIEYMAMMIVSAIVLYAGVTALIDSVKKIFHPEEVTYTVLSFVVLAASIIVKLVLGFYTKKKGEKFHSGALEASGRDALGDAAVSGSVLASALIFRIFGIDIEAYVGALIGLFIIKTGIELIRESVDSILGTRADSGLSTGIRAVIEEEPEVLGAYDLLISNYGPDLNIAAVHIEVDDRMSARELDVLTRRLQEKVYAGTGAVLATVGVYSAHTADDEAAAVRDDVRRRVMSHEGVLQFHGFYVDLESKTLRFDVIIDFAVRDRQALAHEIEEEIRAAYPDYAVHVTLDLDLSD